jgi:RNA polymerase sigma-19 factor, ECF subfamily
MENPYIYEEKILFAAIARGDQGAFAQLFKRYDKRIHFFALRMIKDDTLAEEITQEIFIKLWEKRSTLPEIDNPEAYILTIAANHTLNYIKKYLSAQKTLDRLAEMMREKFEADADELLLLHDSEAAVNQAIQKLPERQKQVYLLSREEGLDYEEIAKILHISRHTVRNHLVEALRSIRLYLEDQGHTSTPIIAFAILLLKN